MKEIALLNIQTELPTHFDFILVLYFIHKPKKNQECWSKIKRRKWRKEKRMEMTKKNSNLI